MTVDEPGAADDQPFRGRLRVLQDVGAVEPVAPDDGDRDADLPGLLEDRDGLTHQGAQHEDVGSARVQLAELGAEVSVALAVALRGRQAGCPACWSAALKTSASLLLNSLVDSYRRAAFFG